MSPARSPAVLRRLAALLIRGPDAPVLLADLDELFHRDVERGLSWWRVRHRYTFNAISSAFSLGRARLARLGIGAGASLLDVRLGVRMLRKQPMLTGVAVLALGLGIPASLGTIHVWRALMAPIPFDEGERIVGIPAPSRASRSAVSMPFT